MLANTSSHGTRSSRSITATTSSVSIGATSSWSFESSVMYSGGNISGRVESTWPILANVGPSSSNASRISRPRAAAECSRALAIPNRVSTLATWAARGSITRPRSSSPSFAGALALLPDVVVLTITTVQRAACETRFGTFPSRNSLRPCMPAFPTTSTSACCSSAPSRSRRTGLRTPARPRCRAPLQAPGLGRSDSLRGQRGRQGRRCPRDARPGGGQALPAPLRQLRSPGNGRLGGSRAIGGDDDARTQAPPPSSDWPSQNARRRHHSPTPDLKRQDAHAGVTRTAFLQAHGLRSRARRERALRRSSCPPRPQLRRRPTSRARRPVSARAPARPPESHPGRAAPDQARLARDAAQPRRRKRMRRLLDRNVQVLRTRKGTWGAHATPT